MYAIALMLPDEVERELERLRGEFASHVAYVPFAHMTVVYPFSTTESSLVADRLVSIAAHTRPFPIVLADCVVTRISGIIISNINRSDIDGVTTRLPRADANAASQY